MKSNKPDFFRESWFVYNFGVNSLCEFKSNQSAKMMKNES